MHGHLVFFRTGLARARLVIRVIIERARVMVFIGLLEERVHVGGLLCGRFFGRLRGRFLGCLRGRFLGRLQGWGVDQGRHIEGCHHVINEAGVLAANFELKQ